MLDSYIFAFWAKSSIDIEPRRIRLKSNSYTTNNILDTVTAATFQVGFLYYCFQFRVLLLDLGVFSCCVLEVASTNVLDAKASGGTLLEN